MSFAFSGVGEGELDVLDVTGRRVAQPWHGTIAGAANAIWSGSDGEGRMAANGVYFARLRVGDVVRTRRIVLAR
jgi:hypothetical protein